MASSCFIILRTPSKLLNNNHQCLIKTGIVNSRLYHCFKTSIACPRAFQGTCNKFPLSSNYGVRDCFNKTCHFNRTFHTTSRREAHPIVLIALKQVAKLGAIVTGRGFRKWWQSLPSNKKAYIWQTLKESRVKIMIGGGMVSGLLVGYYVTHLQVTPVTNRSRYVAFTPEQFMKIAEFEKEIHLEENKDLMVDPKSALVSRVVRIATRIVNSNQDIDTFRKQKWTVFVINEPSQNAFVLPTGHIFVHTGLMQMVLNDDQLAFVLAHEMAHAVLGHGAEHVSHAQIIDWLVIVVMAAIWAFLPSDGVALVTQWFFNKVVKLMITMPYSRKLETEADEVGLQFAAKACYDVRESSNFWNLMSIKDLQEGTERVEWLSTHPTHEQRSDKLDSMMAKVIEMRSECKCPPLRKQDPRIEMRTLKQMVKDQTLVPLSSEVEVQPPSMRPVKTIPVIS